jgi:hypothetical protein
VLRKYSLVAACLCCRNVQSCIHRKQSSGTYGEVALRAPSVMTVLCHIVWAFLLPSFHSCSYVMFNGWCPNSPYRSCRKFYTLRLKETLFHQRLNNVDFHARVPAPMSWHRRLRACRSIRRMCIPPQFDHNQPCCVLCLLHAPNNACIVVTKFYTSWRWRAFRKLNVSGHVLYTLLD